VSDQSNSRTPGDDVVVQLRVRRANLAALEEGVQLGIDSLTGQAIEQRLVRQPDGVYGLEVVTNPIAMLSTPDPVDPEWVE
jgi:hypothetical protein